MPILLGIILICTYYLGILFGIYYRKRTIHKLRSNFHKKPNYQLLYELSPLEFELLITGTISRNGILGEIATMSNQDMLTIDPEKKRIYITNQPEKFNYVQTAIYGFLATRSGHFFAKIEVSGPELTKIVAPVKKHVVRSVQAKGWQIRDNKVPSVNDNISPEMLFWALATTIPPFLAPFFFADPGLYGLARTLSMIAIAIPTFGWLGYALYSIFREGHKQQSKYATQIKKYHAKQWQQLQGISYYLETSGPDTFTPDYGTMKFNDLDQLYPYWVALGFDQQLTNMIFEK